MFLSLLFIYLFMYISFYSDALFKLFFYACDVIITNIASIIAVSTSTIF